MSGQRNIKGEVWFPKDAEQARRKLDEMASASQISPRQIEKSWRLAIELAHASMNLLNIDEDGTPTQDLGLLPSDIDPATARRLLGDDVDELTVDICQRYLARIPLLLDGDRRVSGNYATKTGWFATAIAPYVYEVCKLALGVEDLTPQTWALSEIAFGLDPLPLDDSNEWEQLRDKWRKRKEGDKQIPLTTLTRDLAAALSARSPR